MSSSNDYRGRQDLSWLTEIEKIQAEIAKDLEIPEPTGFEPEEAPGLFWAETPPEPDPWHIPVAMQSTSAPDANGEFYREIIKGKSRGKRSWARTIAVIMLICTLGTGSLGFGLGAAYIWATHQTSGVVYEEPRIMSETPPTITSNHYVFDITERFEADRQQTGTVADMVQLLEPAVVSISTRFDANRQPRAGSGTIFAENEERIFIVTGMYVVYGGSQINVSISGSQPLAARLVSTNPRSGLAAISVDKAQLLNAGIDTVVIARFGDSSEMQVGDTVFAIGNARNDGTSVTRGIISAGKQELIVPRHGYTLTVLQTDAAINYGNSGGPLINIRGEVIGINFDRASDQFGTAQVEGIGYSIASSMVVPILYELIDFNRPGLGIRGMTLTEREIAYMDWNIPAIGVFVASITPGGAAEAAGILPFDVITAFDGESVLTFDGLTGLIRQRQIGDTVEIRVLRNGDTPITLEVQLRALIQ